MALLSHGEPDQCGQRAVAARAVKRCVQDECRMFSFGKYDDQVDAAAREFNHLLNPQVGIFT